MVFWDGPLYLKGVEQFFVAKKISFRLCMNLLEAIFFLARIFFFAHPTPSPSPPSSKNIMVHPLKESCVQGRRLIPFPYPPPSLLIRISNNTVTISKFDFISLFSYVVYTCTWRTEQSKQVPKSEISYTSNDGKVGKLQIAVFRFTGYIHWEIKQWLLGFGCSLVGCCL